MEFSSQHYSQGTFGLSVRFSPKKRKRSQIQSVKKKLNHQLTNSNDASVASPCIQRQEGNREIPTPTDVECRNSIKTLFYAKQSMSVISGTSKEARHLELKLDCASNHRTINDEETHSESYCLKIVSLLQLRQISLVCIDFDRTFLDIHTNGCWEDSADSLKPHVRSLFLHLIPALISSRIYVAITTFSPQHTLVQDLMNTCFDAEVANSILVRANDQSWPIPQQYRGFTQVSMLDTWSWKRKICYVLSAAQFFGAMPGHRFWNC
jgi:hypothetical protein